MTIETTTLPSLPPPGEPALAPFPGRYLRRGGRSLFVRHAEGEFVERVATRPGREPAVFVHGLGGASTNWTDLMALLAPWLDGYALDLPGFGRSDPPVDADYSVAAQVAAVHALVAGMDQAPVHLFGNSLGGLVATRFAARYPQLVRSLVLVSPALPSFRVPAGINPLALLALAPGVGRLAGARLGAVPPERRLAAVLALCYHDLSRVSAQRRREALEELTARTGLGWDQAAFTGSLRGLVRDHAQPGPRGVWRDAARVRAPVLLVWGRDDRLVPVALAERARRSYPQSHLVVFDDSGHVSQMEKPVETARAVLDFLAEVTPQTGR